jgi:hypothetical protein
MNKKAQLHLEFGAGFFLFILVVSYIAFSVINTMPDYYQNLRDDRIRMNVWSLSEKIERMTTNELDELVACNYDDLKNRFDINDVKNFHVNITNYPIAITDEFDGSDYIGNLMINGESVNFVVDIINNEVDISYGGTTYNNKKEGDDVDINGEDYYIKKIDEQGQFVILGRNLADCGMKTPDIGNIVLAVRYSNFDSHLTKLRVEYW